MTNCQRYKELCGERPDIPLFMQAWWLDAVCMPEKKEWNVLFTEENGEIVGVMPYHVLKKWGFKIILQPQLTQFNGIWIDYPNDLKLHKRYSFEKRVMDNLIDQLEKLKVSHYSQNFHYSFTNWQPFFWRGFRQITRYTYQITNLNALETIYNSFSYAKRRHLNKKNDDLLIDFSISADEFYDFHQECLSHKNKKSEYSRKLFLSIYNESVKRGKGMIIAMKDKNQILHSALFFVWDEKSSYTLASAIKPQFKSGSASTKMFWEAIKFMSNKTQIFDFTGSMIEGVALSFQLFEAKQVPYFNISKSYSRFFSLFIAIKNAITSISNG
jgi:hypothetical protein